ncbi:hypothetical protein CRYUN_Cryun21dG0104400 [Craigia yunnanensis]
MAPGFKAYAKQVKANAVALGKYLISKGYQLVTGGTENHLVLWDLRPLGLTGMAVELVGLRATRLRSFVTCATSPSIRMLYSVTAVPCLPEEYKLIGEFLHRAVTITLNIQKQYGKLLKDFNKGLDNKKEIEELKADVEKFSSSYDMPGFQMSEMKYRD